MYRDRASILPGCVVWTKTSTSGRGRILPDGCMDVIWIAGELVVAGSDTHAITVTNSPGARYTGLRFAPGTGAAVLGVAAAELLDRRVPLGSIWPAGRARRLAEQVAASSRPGAVLERNFLPWWQRHEARIADAARLTALIDSGRGMSAVAAALGCSGRQLHRRAVETYGYGPKLLARVLRVNRAIDLARAGARFADAAALSGFADQPHLARDVKDLTGVSLGELLGDEAGYEASGANRSTALPSGSEMVA